MRIGVIGAGALGGSIGARLAHAGHDVTLVDAWEAHVAAINRHGLAADGRPAPVRVRVTAALPDAAPQGFDLVLIATDSNNTQAAAAQARHGLAADGYALTIQNGIGNVEALTDALGVDRVIAGSTMCSFRALGPGHVDQTHLGPTTVGELQGRRTARVRALAAMLEGAGYETLVSDDIAGVIWTKFVLNSAINAICANTGLRLGELVRCPATDRFQDLVLDEIFAVVRAKGLGLPEAELRRTIKAHCWAKFSKPSMLQHIEAGRQTEIDALNGALVREAERLGVAVPYNDAVTRLVKGRELHERHRIHEPELDYAALEAWAQHEPRPGA